MQAAEGGVYAGVGLRVQRTVWRADDAVRVAKHQVPTRWIFLSSPPRPGLGGKQHHVVFCTRGRDLDSRTEDSHATRLVRAVPLGSLPSLQRSMLARKAACQLLPRTSPDAVSFSCCCCIVTVCRCLVNRQLLCPFVLRPLYCRTGPPRTSRWPPLPLIELPQWP